MIQAEANSDELNRFISVRWADETDHTFQSMLCITASDRPNLLLDIMTAVAELKTPAINVNARTGKNNLAIIELTLEIFDTEQLDKTIKRLQNVDSVLSVVRRRQ